LEFVAVRPCKFDAYEAVPRTRLNLDLGECEERLRSAGYEIVSNAGVMLVAKKGAEVTVYPHGRLLMHPAKDKDEAERIARAVYSALGM
jgi:TATA-box binding protein (TBP) (component of TFIID and TFIIIB)